MVNEKPNRRAILLTDGISLLVQTAAPEQPHSGDPRKVGNMCCWLQFSLAGWAEPALFFVTTLSWGLAVFSQTELAVALACVHGDGGVRR